MIKLQPLAKATVENKENYLDGEEGSVTSATRREIPFKPKSEGRT